MEGGASSTTPEHIVKNFEGGKYAFHRFELQQMSDKGFPGGAERHAAALDTSEEASIAAIGFKQGDIGIFDTRDGTCKSRIEADQPDGKVLNDVRLIARGKKLVTGGGSKNVNMWDVETGSLEVSLEGHSGEISVVRGNPRALITASVSDDCINVWDVRKKASTKTLYPSGSVVAMDYYQTPAFTLVTGLAHSVRVWDMRKTGEVLKEFSVGGCLCCLAISPAHDRVMVGSSDKNGDGILTICNTATWDVTHAVRDIGGTRQAKFGAVFNVHVDEHKIVAASQNASEGAANGKIHVWKTTADISVAPQHLYAIAEPHGGYQNSVSVKATSIVGVGEGTTFEPATHHMLKWDFS